MWRANTRIQEPSEEILRNVQDHRKEPSITGEQGTITETKGDDYIMLFSVTYQYGGVEGDKNPMFSLLTTPSSCHQTPMIEDDAVGDGYTLGLPLFSCIIPFPPSPLFSCRWTSLTTHGMGGIASDRLVIPSSSPYHPSSISQGGP